MRKRSVPGHVRWMIRRDMPPTLRIEAASFPSPWVEEDFLKCLRTQNCIGMVVERQAGGVLGYMVYELHKTHLTLLNLAVDPDHRRDGLGSMMVGKLLAKLCSHRRTAVLVTPGERNLGAQLFFKSHGFRAEGVARLLYKDTGEDGYRMAYREQPLGPPSLELPNRLSAYTEDDA